MYSFSFPLGMTYWDALAIVQQAITDYQGELIEFEAVANTMARNEEYADLAQMSPEELMLRATEPATDPLREFYRSLAKELVEYMLGTPEREGSTVGVTENTYAWHIDEYEDVDALFEAFFQLPDDILMSPFDAATAK